MRRAQHPDLPYVTGVVDGSLSQHDFVRSQLQFFFAVEAYPKHLMALAARSTGPKAKPTLEANIRDESGQGHAASSHVATFRALLANLGISAAETDRTAHWPCVDAFNAGVRAACADRPEAFGLATVAAIEDVFTTISRDMGRAIVQRGWLGPDEVVHYNVHEVLDREHADALYAALDAAGPDAGEQISAGLKNGAELMRDLYAGLLRGS